MSGLRCYRLNCLLLIIGWLSSFYLLGSNGCIGLLIKYEDEDCKQNHPRYSRIWMERSSRISSEMFSRFTPVSSPIFFRR